MKAEESNSGVCDVLVKTYLDPDLFLHFRDVCKEVGLKHSSALRTLVKQWIAVHRRPQAVKVEGPKVGQVFGVPSHGSRVNYGSTPGRLQS
jgi:hypothetical protein